MNSGFRNLLVRRDTTRFKAYFLAIALQMSIVPFLQYFGFIEITVPPFYPLGATLGGFLFGLAMNWGGGCAGGIWYKLGGGNMSVLIAIVGLVIGYVATEVGVLKSLRRSLQSFAFDESFSSITLGSIFNLPLWKVSLPLSIILLFFLLRSPHTSSKQVWSWWKVGIGVGVVGILAWLASSLSRRFYGMAVLPGSKDLHDLFLIGKEGALSWDLFFVLGIPVGGLLFNLQSGKLAWSSVSGVAIWPLLAGGFALGFSASLAGGCTVGHGLTGFPLLSLGSIAFTIFAIFGSWFGVFLEKRTPGMNQKEK